MLEIMTNETESAAKIMYADASAEVLAEKAKEYENLQSSVLSAARRGYVDLITGMHMVMI